MTFTDKATNFIDEAYSIVYRKVVSGFLEKELNYTRCRVEINKDDFNTLWVKWGNYDCKFIDLPARAMATIADNIDRF